MRDEGSFRDPVVGTTIANSFQIESILGRGGMGVVYRAIELLHGRKVAIKILPPSIGVDPEEMRNVSSRFDMETEVLSSMRHPGIVEYLGGGTSPDGSRYLAMEFLAGETLLTRARRAPLEIEEVLDIGEQACEALAYAHRNGVIHRDLKPANLFLCENESNQVKLIDFGIARFIDDRKRLTRTGGFIGTPAYMAPEQLRGETNIDGRVDLYALGVTLYEAMSHRLPIDAPDTISLLLRILNERPRPIHEIRKDVPPALARIFTRALAKVPKERYSDADQMAEAFREARKRPGDIEQRTRATRALRSSSTGPVTPPIDITQKVLSIKALEEKGYSSPDLYADLFEEDLDSSQTPSQTFRENFDQQSEVLQNESNSDTFREEVPELLSDSYENLEDIPTQVKEKAFHEFRRVIVVLVNGAMGKRSPQSALEQAAKSLGEAGGRVEKLYDGRVVALFGASHTYGDEARRAILGALGGRSKDVCIGIGSGRLLTSEQTENGGAIPQATYLLDHARPGEVLVSAEAFRRTRGLFDAKAAGHDAYLILAERRHGVLIGTRSLLGVETPTVGRHKEIDALQDEFSHVLQTNTPKGSLVVAEAGMGKSRLKYEFRLALEEMGKEFLYFEGFGDPIRAQTPYALLGSAIKTFGAIRASDSLDMRRRKLQELIKRLLGEAKDSSEIFELIASAIGIEIPQSSLTSGLYLNPQGLRDKIQEAFVRVFSAAASHSSVLLILEDLHWSDEATLAVVNRLLLQPSLAFFLVGTARPSIFEDFPNLFEDRDCLHIELSPLKNEAIEALLQAFLGGKPPKELLSFLEDATGGNPLLIEEILATLRDENVLSLDGFGNFTVTRDLDNVPIPEGAEALLQARLDHLPVEEKETLKRASIFGRVFWAEGLETLGISDAPMLLENLRHKEFVSLHAESRMAPNQEFVFRHALLCDVAYGLLPEQERKVLHARVAYWLEKNGEEDFSLLARHHRLAGHRERAIELYTHSAFHAASEYEVDAALRAIQQARLLQNDQNELFSLLLLEEDLYFWSGERAENRRVLGEISSLIGEKDERTQLQVAYRESRYANRIGECSHVETLARESLKRAYELGDKQNGVLLLGELIWSILNLGRYEEGLSLARQGIPSARSLKQQDQLALLLILIGFGHSRRGELGLAARYTKEGLENAHAARDIRLEAMALGNLGSTLVVLGAYQEGEKFTRQAIELAENSQNAQALTFGLLNLGNNLALQNRFEEGEESLTRCFRMAERIEHAELPDYVRSYLAHLYLLRGRAKDSKLALELVEQLLNKPEILQSQLGAYAYLWQAQAYLALGEPEKALHSVEAARQIRENLGSLEEEEEELLLTYYRVLATLNYVEETFEALKHANDFVEERAKRIGDPTYRESYLLYSTPAVAIQKAWQNLEKQS